MEREEQLKFCKQCQHRKMDMSRGLLCGLTDQWADFQGNCPDFMKDTLSPKTISAFDRENVEIEEAFIQPYNYWKNLKKIILTLLGIHLITLVFILLYFRLSENGEVYEKFGVYISIILTSFPFWFLVGWVLNKIKTGLIAASIAVCTHLIVHIFEIKYGLFLVSVPLILGGIYFSVQTLKDTGKVVRFVTASIIVVMGGLNFYAWPRLNFIDEFGRFLGDILGTEYFFRYGLFSIQVGEGHEIIIPFDGFFSGMFASIFSVLAMTYVFYHIRDKQKFNFKLLQIGRRITAKKMAVYTVVFYTSIFCLALGVLAFIYDLFKHISILNGHLVTQIANEYYLRILIIIVSGLILLTYTVLFFRKLVLEYYLDHGKPIGWSYYFSYVPIVGVAVWAYNLIAWKPVQLPSKEPRAQRSTPETSLPIFLTIIMIIYSLAQISLVHNDAIVVIMILVGLGLYLLYLYEASGVYVLIGVQVFVFLIVIVLSIFGQYMPQGILSEFLFWSLAQALLVYPAFHMKTFRIQIPKVSGENPIAKNDPSVPFDEII